MGLRHVCALLGLASVVGACGSLIGVQDLGVDPAPVKSKPDAQPPPPEDAETIPPDEDAGADATPVPPPLDAGCFEKATAANPPTLVTAMGSGDGWGNLSNVEIRDDSPAQCTGTGQPTSQVIYAHGFEFAVPATAQIHGVKVTIRTKGNASADGVVQLTPDGGAQGQNLASASYGGTFVDRVYGSETNTWGLPLTPALVNDSRFGVAFSVKLGLPFPIAYVDVIQMSILYCE